MKNKLFKGAVAGAAGVALLLGGAGTFAWWNDQTSMGGNQTITAGQLFFNEDGDSAWQLNGEAIDQSGLDTLLIVPGDTLTYRLTDATVTATGNNMAAVVGIDWAGATVPGGAANQELHDNLNVAVSMGGTDITTVPTAIPDTGTDVALGDIVVTLELPTTVSGTTAQGGTLDLGDFHLTLTQVAPTP